MKRPMFAIAPRYTEEELAEAIRSVERKFPEDVEYIRYTVREDWSEDTAIFTRVLLKDKPDLIKMVENPKDETLKDALEITNRISQELWTALREFDLPVYFAFRLVSEQSLLKDADWE